MMKIVKEIAVNYLRIPDKPKDNIFVFPKISITK